MSGFKVAPMDGGCPVALPPGETVIGRGSLLGITDKRVSRKHAILKVTGDQLCIKPVHINPCFYRPSENSQLLPLDTDEWHQLNPGDNFSLLLDKYAFRVLSTHSDMEDLQSQKSGNLDAEELANPSSKVFPRQCSLQETSSSSIGKPLETSTLSERSAEIPQQFPASVAEPEKPRPVSRKRVLPAWMLQGNLVVPDASPSVSGRGRKEERKTNPGKKQKTTSSEEAALSLQDIQTVATESAVPKVEKSNSRVLPQIPKMSVVQNECLESRQPGHQPLERDTTNKKESKEDSAASEMENQRMTSHSPVHQDENEWSIPPQPTETRVSDFTGSSDVPQSSNVTKSKRIPCQYGRSCYRKNPVHFQQFSHPGDDDYDAPEAVTSAEDDRRPECPYGTACYRKNPQHKIEYKHTAPPVPLETERRQTRPKPAKIGRSVLDDDLDDDGEPNEYNLDDSFIDDEEEEECDPTDEDSDWEPDFEDKDNEDVDTLMKEAQQFVKTKK